MTPEQWVLAVCGALILINCVLLFGLNDRITKMQRDLEQRGVL